MQVLLSVAKSYPNKLISFLNKSLPYIKGIKSAYMASIQYPSDPYPKVLIGLVVDGEINEIIIDLSKQAEASQIPLEMIEFTDAINGYFQNYFSQIDPFYQATHKK
jgi:SseB protein C-terminal domain